MRNLPIHINNQRSNFPCLILICMLLTALFCGCNHHISGIYASGPPDEFGDVDKLAFHDDGTVILDSVLANLKGTYTISGDMITIVWTGGGDFDAVIKKNSDKIRKFRIQGNDLIDIGRNNHGWHKTQ